jgi:hypothetical protein
MALRHGRKGFPVRSKVVWAAALAAIVALTAAGCTTSVTGQAAGSASTSNSATPSGSAITVATMHVTLPQGVRYTETSSDGSLDGCLSAGSVVCEARMLDLRAASADPNVPFSAPSTSRPYGWYTGTDVPRCMTPAGAGTEATGSKVLDQGYTPIGPKKASYARWEVTCSDPAQNNQVRVWWLPTSKILVTEYASTPALDTQVDQILAAATFG